MFNGLMLPFTQRRRWRGRIRRCKSSQLHRRKLFVNDRETLREKLLGICANSASHLRSRQHKAPSLDLFLCLQTQLCLHTCWLWVVRYNITSVKHNASRAMISNGAFLCRPSNISCPCWRLAIKQWWRCSWFPISQPLPHSPLSLRIFTTPLFYVAIILHWACNGGTMKSVVEGRGKAGRLPSFICGSYDSHLLPPFLAAWLPTLLATSGRLVFVDSLSLSLNSFPSCQRSRSCFSPSYFLIHIPWWTCTTLLFCFFSIFFSWVMILVTYLQFD